MKRRKPSSWSGCVRRAAWIGMLATLSWSSTSAAEKVRVYPFGEEDPDGDVGEVVVETNDVQIPPTQDANGDPVSDSLGDLVLLTAVGDPVYVEGRTGEGSLAIEFDGVDDQLTSGAFDPRNFSTFSALSQAWIKPDSAKQGTEQAIWSLGNDNGGVGITADGFWEIIAVSIIPDTPSTTAVAFDEWTHVAILRGGNGAQLFINGTLAASGDNFWNGVGPVTVGNRTSGGEAFAGVIDDFNIAGFSDLDFDSARDIDFFLGDVSGVFGDVNQDGTVDAADYAVWSANVGFDNGLGGGDGNTLRMGDVDQDGRIGYFDFQIILAEATEPAAPELDASGVIVADDFFYSEPTKVLGPGGGFTLQDYGGGRGLWGGRWVSIGNGIITGPDFEPREQRFVGLTTTGLSANSLGRPFSVDGLSAEQTIFFSFRILIPDGEAPIGRFVLNSPDEEAAEISVGIDPGLGFTGKLGTSLEFPIDIAPTIEPDVFHVLVGKLEVNAVGDDEILSVWYDPDGEELSDDELFVQADVIASVADLQGLLRLDRGTTGGGRIFWDDVAVGTSWAAVTELEIPRLAVDVSSETGEVSLVNDSENDVEINFYHLSSASGSLDVAGWVSLSDAAPDEWSRNNPSAKLLTESSFGASRTIAAGTSLSLGAAFSTDGVQDLVVRFATTDGLFNVAQSDRDADDVFDVDDNCPLTANSTQEDADADGFGDVCDNCPGDANPEQEDLDGDGVGNFCDDEIADTFRDWSLTGTQGENNMFYGYFDRSQDLLDGADGNYEADKFTEFLNDGSELITPDAFGWRDSLNHWTGAAWDLTSAGAAPWTFLGPLDVHPNDNDPDDEQWVGRRWVSDRSTNVSVLWHAHHENVVCGGSGVTGLLYHNDELVDEQAIAASDNVGVTRSVELSIRAGDTIDLLLNSTGPLGLDDDGCDGSQTWFLVTDLGGGGPEFHRADIDASGPPASSVNITDGVFLLNFLFLGGPNPPCDDAADADDSGGINITDAIFTLNFLFLGGPAPPAPSSAAACGTDPTDDALDCASYDNCG